MTDSKRRLRDIERIREEMLKRKIIREFDEMGIEPRPEKVQEILERRRETVRGRNPVTRYFDFYKNSVRPLTPRIKEIIDTTRTRQMKISIRDFSKRLGILGPKKNIISSTEPLLLLEGLSIDREDDIIRLSKACQANKLSESSKQFVNDICSIDPQTDSHNILEFLNRVCRLK